MKAIVGDLWAVEADFRSIPTNGDVNSKGSAIMGTGVALQARKRFPWVVEELGGALFHWGNNL